MEGFIVEPSPKGETAFASENITPNEVLCE
jgi:hypothetical protein